MKTRTALAAAAVAALLAAGAAPAFAASDPAVPQDCVVGAAAYTSAGVPTGYRYENGVTSATANKALSLGFAPSAWVNVGGRGSTDFPASFRSSNLAIDAGGALWSVTTEGRQLTQRKWDYSITKTQLATGWGGVRAIASGYPYEYALTASGLDRYAHSDGTAAPAPAGTVATTGFASVRNLTFDRQVTLATGGQADVLLATDASSGALVEFTVPHDAPGSWTRAILKPTGFADVTSLNTGACPTSGGRPLLAIESDGDAFVTYDPNHADASAADFLGGTTRVASKWTLRAFSQ